MSGPSSEPSPGSSLDPADWDAFRAVAHRLLDASLDRVRDAREGPVWQPVPAELEAAMSRPLPQAPTATAEVARELAELILPHGVGNLHPRFFGWVHGAGTAGGVLAEMVAAALNANSGGRDHGAIRVERQVLAWAREIMGFPPESSGLLVSGTSMANLLAVQVARTSFLGPEARSLGVAAALAAKFPGSRGLTAYTSSAAHSSVVKALEVAGLGTAALRLIPADADHRLPPAALEAAIGADREAGYTPFLVVGTAGTVDIGAVDDLTALRSLARTHRLWFHVDGAFGALLRLSPEHRGRLAGLEQADSLAFDFHKWAHVPYDAGCLLVRDAGVHRATFGMEPAYLSRATRGTAAGSPWPCDYGVELSRGARAVKVWATLREHGLGRIGASIAANCRIAAALAARIETEPELELELLAPVPLNIVCFRHHPPGLAGDALDRHNHEVACDVQESGKAVVSTTRIGGKLALRVAVVNHRTTGEDIPILIKAILDAGRGRVQAG